MTSRQTGCKPSRLSLASECAPDKPVRMTDGTPMAAKLHGTRVPLKTAIAVINGPSSSAEASEYGANSEIPNPKSDEILRLTARCR